MEQLFVLAGTPQFWFALTAAILLQIALSPDNLIVVSVIAKKIPSEQRSKIINFGMVIGMGLRIGLLWLILTIINLSSRVWMTLDIGWLQGSYNTKSLIFIAGGVFLMWKGIDSISMKLRGIEEVHHNSKGDLTKHIITIALINVLFSFDSTFAVIAVTNSLTIVIVSSIIALFFMLFFAKKMCDFVAQKPDFEVLGLGLVSSIGFVLLMDGAYEAKMSAFGMPAINISQGLFILYVLFVFFLGWIQDVIKVRRDDPLHLKRKFKSNGA